MAKVRVPPLLLNPKRQRPPSRPRGAMALGTEGPRATAITAQSALQTALVPLAKSNPLLPNYL